MQRAAHHRCQPERSCGATANWHCWLKGSDLASQPVETHGVEHSGILPLIAICNTVAIKRSTPNRTVNSITRSFTLVPVSSSGQATGCIQFQIELNSEVVLRHFFVDYDVIMT